jgi:ABC-2 type transport system permease protein
MKSRIPAIAKKEFIHIIRDWRTLVMAFGLPLVMLILFGYAITFDIREIRLAVFDADRSSQSAKLLERFTSSGYFKIKAYTDSDRALGNFLDIGLAQIAMSVPKDYSKNISRNENVKIAVLVDGAESNSANIAAGYVTKILSDTTIEFAMDYVRSLGVSNPPPIPQIDLRCRYWYNDELRSQNYIIPGLIATIMMVMTAILTSLTIVKEREVGTLEQLISTPVRTYEIMIGKIIPYFIIGMIDSIMVALIGVLVMGVPFRGSVWLFLSGTALFAMAGLGIGLRISTAAQNQVVAMQMALLSSMLPSFLLSGFVFAIKNMPAWVQAITYIVPARYFLVVLRGIFLKDAVFSMLWLEFLFLGLLCAVMLITCIKSFKKKVG